MKAFKALNIEPAHGFEEWMEKVPEMVHMKKYEGKPEFDPSFYAIG